METVVGSVIGATVEAVLQNMLSISSEEINLVRNLKKDLGNLKRSFMMIQNVLQDAEMQEVTSGAVKLWLKNLESVAFEADNVIDDLNYHVLLNKNQDNMMEKIKTFFTPSNPIVFLRKMAHNIKDINEKLKLINQEARDFGLRAMKPVGAGSNLVASRETDPFTADPFVSGRDDDVSNIVKMLTTSPAEQVFSVLPILGMGGLGKTTLARQVFNHEKIKAQFENQIWVYVSRNFNAKTLFKKILVSLTKESTQLEDRGVLLEKLQKELSGKRYLLVLDDLWNEDRVNWDDFKDSLCGVSSAKGNSMIVTTRGQEVASMVKTLAIYELKGLSGEECWSVIRAKAFREGKDPSQFETIGRNIADKCQGLPLAAKVVGGLLCDKSKDEWLAIEKTWLSNFGEDEDTILKVLKFSFDHLTSTSLKKCFAYSSIFPKGFRIKREQLIELWAAEGFLTTNQNNDMETVGNKFFNRLVQNSLLQDVKRDNFGNITDCNMHDVVHDLAIRVLGSKSYCVNENSLDDIYQVRYIGPESIRDDLFPMPEQQARCVRTLFFNGNVTDDMFLDFESLHTLVLMSQDVKELPSLIWKLVRLRLLDISNTRIECLPDWIGKLYHLQTLRVGDDLRRLPKTIKYLTCLRHLHIPKIELPPEIGKLTSLQTLPFFKVGHGKGCRIGELGSLKNLKGEVEICNLERVNDKEEAESARLFQKPNIFKLKFAWDKSREGEMNHENVLEGLQPHQNLKSLEIYGYKGQCYPSWISEMVDNLMEIRLTSCRKCVELPALGHLPHLKFLYLNGLTNVRSIGLSFYGLEEVSMSTSNRGGKKMTISFPALESLELSEMPNLREWMEVPAVAETQIHEIVVFPHLERLVISKCSKLMSAPSHFPCLKVLKIREMDSGAPLANVCGRNLISLTELDIYGVSGLVSLPDALFYNNRNLSSVKIMKCPNLMHLVSSLRGGGDSLRLLEIENCPNLRELPNDLHTLSSTENLVMGFCSNLKSIPYASGEQLRDGFTSLHYLSIQGVKALPSEMLEPFAASRGTFHLIELSSLTNLPMVIGCLQKMPWLRHLSIIDVPKLTNFSTEIGPLHSLDFLAIEVSSSDALDYTLFKEFLDNLFRGLQSLSWLHLGGMEHWDSLPDQLLHLTALSYLTVDGFGIEALPEWFGNMSSLKLIVLANCKKLRHLPRGLPELTELSIYDCPLLNVQRCNEQQSDDSQWPKISHIPRVFVDGREI